MQFQEENLICFLDTHQQRAPHRPASFVDFYRSVSLVMASNGIQFQKGFAPA